MELTKESYERLKKKHSKRIQSGRVRPTTQAKRLSNAREEQRRREIKERILERA